MKFYILNVHILRKYFLFAIVMILAIAAMISLNPAITEVLNPQKELPIYSVECEEKKLAITFDCAWGAEDIEDILKILEEHRVKTTFFMVGRWAEKHPDSVRLMAQKGHDIGNHSYSHLRMGVLGKEKIKEEIQKGREALEQISMKKVDLFRAPYGDYNDDVIRTATSLGCFTIQWNIDSLDWKPQIAPEEILKRVTSKLESGAILLFHNDTAHTVQLLPQILKHIQQNGFEIVPVSQLIFRENSTIDVEGRQRNKQAPK